MVAAGREARSDIGHEQAECARTLLGSRIVVWLRADVLESAKVALHEWAAEKMERERQGDDGYDAPEALVFGFAARDFVHRADNP
ncbi:MAG: hypothetical protein ACLP01_32210 [Solirubrobacteraceae bacterium]